MSLTKQYFKYVSQNIFGLLGTSCYILADTYFISQAAGTSGVALLNLCLPIYNKADRHTDGAGGVQRGKMGGAAGAGHAAGAGKGQHFSICGPVSAQLFGCIEQLRRTGAAA